MALKDEFEARFSAEYRKKISNPDTRQPSAQNETLVAQAVTDAEAEFPIVVQIEYDSDEVSHIQVAVKMVEIWLLEYGAAPAATIEKKIQRMNERIDALRKVTARRRITPTGSSSYSHSTPSSAKRPEFDEEQFEDFTPRAPGRDEE